MHLFSFKFSSIFKYSHALYCALVYFYRPLCGFIISVFLFSNLIFFCMYFICHYWRQLKMAPQLHCCSHLGWNQKT